jgi:hypothetical protein
MAEFDVEACYRSGPPVPLEAGATRRRRRERVNDHTEAVLSGLRKIPGIRFGSTR